MNFLFKYLLLVSMLLFAGELKSFGQCTTYAALDGKVKEIYTNDSLSYEEKLKQLYSLKSNAERCRLVNDSSYASLLRSIGNCEYWAHKNTPLAIRFTSDAIRINNALKERRSQHLASVSYYSIGYYNENAKLYRQALTYYDSATIWSSNANDIKLVRMPSRQNKAVIYFLLGDYQKSVEECILGMKDAVITKDTFRYLVLLNLKAQSLCFQDSLQQALTDADAAMLLAQKLQDSFELATAYKTHGLLFEKNNENNTAKDFFKKAVEARKSTKKYAAIASDYNDLGNFYLNSEYVYREAKKNYFHAIAYAQKMDAGIKRSSKLALAYSNLGDNSLKDNKLEEAADFYTTAFKYLNISLPGYLFSNPTEAQLRIIEHKELVYNLLVQKTSFLLKKYLQSHDANCLNACLQTALLTDSVITHTRHEQTGEVSKLFWRNNTRQFFALAMEACYLAGNANLAFYFMEKSRAVLLNDKLNELGASAHLPVAQAAKEESMQTKVIETEQELALLNSGSKEYNEAQYRCLNAKIELEHFIASLEQKYPAYYQYKYADEVPALTSLQQYLAQNHQSFVHYFLDDTLLYALGITPKKVTFIRLSSQDFDHHQLPAFLSLCSDKEKLNNSYSTFASLAQNINNHLFKPLQLPYGKVAICTDDFLIPFEALCADAGGRNFLIYHYSFSYVYSARTLMKPYKNNTAENGNFAGFAPVAFAPKLRLVTLNQSADALSLSAGFFSHPALFTRDEATRNNFFNHASGYAVITVFSHARADTSYREPVLYMQDSAIHLSELQLLKGGATQFVLLSACQTNTGKTAAGEGIYSLARGFAAAGIPSIAGTLWKADDQTIYRISSKFNEYLAAGMNKSEALQKAKLWFLKNEPYSEHQLPYYWANMVVIGNTQPVTLEKGNAGWWWVAVSTGIAAIVFFMLKQKRRAFSLTPKNNTRQHQQLLRN